MGIIFGIFVFITTLSIFAIGWVCLSPMLEDVGEVSNQWTIDNPDLYQKDIYDAKVTTLIFFKYSPFVVIIALTIMLLVIANKKEDEP